MRRVVLAALAVCALVATPAPGRMRSGIPPTVELDGCVLPAPECPAPRDVITMKTGDRSLEFAVDAIRLPTSGGSTSKILTELKLRPLAVHGPKELVSKLGAGTHLRVRGALRLGPQYLLLQSVEPLPTK